MMSLEQAIAQYEQFANTCRYHNLTESQEEFEQLTEWLRELQETRKERDYWQEKANSYEQTIFKLTDAISKQPEIVRCGECRHRDPEDKKCDCGHGIIWQLPRDDDWYCADAKRRTDE